MAGGVASQAGRLMRFTDMALLKLKKIETLELGPNLSTYSASDNCWRTASEGQSSFPAVSGVTLGNNESRFASPLPNCPHVRFCRMEAHQNLTTLLCILRRELLPPHTYRRSFPRLDRTTSPFLPRHRLFIARNSSHMRRSAFSSWTPCVANASSLVHAALIGFSRVPISCSF